MVMTKTDTGNRAPSVKINNTEFQNVRSFRYLGYFLTSENQISNENKHKLAKGKNYYLNIYSAKMYREHII